MLKSLTGISLTADAVIRSWHTWANGSLVEGLDTRSGPKKVGELRAVKTQAESHRDSAAALIANPSFATLSPEYQDDLRAIVEETTITIDMLDDECDPDKKWAKADLGSKLDAVGGLRVDNTIVDVIKARAQGKLRDQVAHPPRPEPPKK